MSLALRYAWFAALATAANLLSQEAVLALLRSAGYALYGAMAVGTGVGLYVKYVLDKRFIFAYRTRSAAHDLRTFVLYAASGVFTTLVFWGSELGFYHVFDSHAWRNVGAVLGLAVGYWLKYRLDRRFAFATARGAVAG
ncbi:GtrA family protein [Acidihalobacter prosperus]|uniref:GtrA/DPMS transmembrane domain-containing protein n=1 Tax=Acidihalobacter prosperus TaxID=160660 RepID=A0A1A6C7B7_9GAMM|nr:GtrA family protein [Acidihalobacter prosperus]OBS10456.1 hypothetical protein Thpro_020172 [Acidihalobacter prosperus]